MRKHKNTTKVLQRTCRLSTPFGVLLVNNWKVLIKIVLLRPCERPVFAGVPDVNINHRRAISVSSRIETRRVGNRVMSFRFPLGLPRRLTTGRRQRAQRVSRLSVGLVSMEAATGQPLRRHSPSNPVVLSERLNFVMILVRRLHPPSITAYRMLALEKHFWKHSA